VAWEKAPFATSSILLYAQHLLRHYVYWLLRHNNTSQSVGKAQKQLVGVSSDSWDPPILSTCFCLISAGSVHRWYHIRRGWFYCNSGEQIIFRPGYLFWLHHSLCKLMDTSLHRTSLWIQEETSSLITCRWMPNKMYPKVLIFICHGTNEFSLLPFFHFISWLCFRKTK
jgi:hypothetical protein